MALSADDKGEIVRAFLSRPRDQVTYERFFHLCFASVRATILHLKGRGWSNLPLDLTDPTKAVNNLACSILGALLASPRGNQFETIFKYFQRCDWEKVLTAQPETIYDLYLRLVRSFTKQEIFRISRAENPQPAKLKERIKKIVRSGKYSAIDRGAETLVALVDVDSSNPDEHTQMPYFELVELVRCSWQESSNRSEWVAHVFRSLAENGEFSDWIRLSDLLSAMVMIESEAVELDGLIPNHLPGPADSLLRRELEAEVTATVQTAVCGKAQNLSAKGRVNQSEAEAMSRAAASYLTDAISGGVDPLPDYLRSEIPAAAEKSRYQQYYKYPFDAIIHVATTDFRQRCEENPLIRRYGDYLGY